MCRLCLTSFLLCAGCAVGPDAGLDDTYPATAQLAPPPGCHEFSVPVVVDGEWRDAVGQACQQADGRWHVVASAPGAPPQIYTLPPETVWMTPYPPPWSWTAAPFFIDDLFIAGDLFVFDAVNDGHRGERRHHHHESAKHAEPVHGGRH